MTATLRIWLVFSVLAIPEPAGAEPRGDAVLLTTPPLGSLSDGWRALAAALVPDAVDPWAPPLPLDATDSPLDRDRGARFHLDGSGAGVWLFPLRSGAPRSDVTAWLIRHGARTLEAGVAEWHMPAAAPRLEAACRATPAWLACQRPVGPDGPQALHAALERAQRATAARPPGSAGAWQLRVVPPRLSEWVRRHIVEAAERQARLLDPPARRRARAQAVTWARIWAYTLGEIPEVTLEGDLTRREARMTGSVRFSSTTWPNVAAWLGAGRADPRLVGWSRTPALLQLWANLDPRVAHHVMRSWLGQTVPGLRGDFGMLWLGVRSRCEGCGPRTDAWTALFPGAAAFQIGPPEAESVMASLVGRTSTASAHRVEILTRAGPTELMLAHETLFVTTGEGLGAAASRRWSQCDASHREEDVVLHAKADLQAIHAALELHDGANEPPEVRRLHRMLELLSSALHPRRWVEIDAEPAEPRAMRVELRAFP